MLSYLFLSLPSEEDCSTGYAPWVQFQHDHGRTGIGTIPGSAFGESGEGHLRISFGCLSDEDLEPAMKLLSEVSFPD